MNAVLNAAGELPRNGRIYGENGGACYEWKNTLLFSIIDMNARGIYLRGLIRLITNRFEDSFPGELKI